MSSAAGSGVPELGKERPPLPGRDRSSLDDEPEPLVDPHPHGGRARDREELTPTGIGRPLALPFRPACRVEVPRERVVAAGAVRVCATARSGRDGRGVSRVGSPPLPARGDQGSCLRARLRPGGPGAVRARGGARRPARRASAHRHGVRGGRVGAPPVRRIRVHAEREPRRASVGERPTVPLEGLALARTGGRGTRPRPCRGSRPPASLAATARPR